MAGAPKPGYTNYVQQQPPQQQQPPNNQFSQQPQYNYNQQPNYYQKPPAQQQAPPHTNLQIEQNYQPDDQDAKYYAQFQNRRFRKAFIVKVLCIVFMMLAWTVAVSVAFYKVEPIKAAFRRNNWIIIMCSIVGFGIMLAISCFHKVARSYPLNVIMLTIFTLVESIVVAAFTAQFNTQILIMSFAMTGTIVIGCIILAAFGCIDFTKCGTILCYITLFVFLAIIVISIFLGIHSKYTGAFSRKEQIIFGVISIVVAVLSSVWLVFDLQMLLGGRRYELSPDDYVFGAMAIFMDLINIFLSITNAINIFGNQ